MKLFIQTYQFGHPYYWSYWNDTHPRKEVDFVMRVYFCFPETIENTIEQRNAEEKVARDFNAKVESSRYHRHKSETSLFEIVTKCDGVVVRPFQHGFPDHHATYVEKVMRSLKRPIYYLGANTSLVRHV